jgi:predicted SAM-dependent methyltransferase
MKFEDFIQEEERMKYEKIKTFLKKILTHFGIEIRLIKDKYQCSVYQALYHTSTLEKKPFYNVGAGSFRHPYWTNLDYQSEWYKSVQNDFIQFNLMAKESLPIETNSAEVIYTSHTIEHVKEDAVIVFFNEAFRCLKPNGVFRVTTGPDAETDFRAMLRGDKYWFYWDENYMHPGTYEEIYHQPANSVPIEERWLHHVASALCPNDKTPSRNKYDSKEIRRIVHELGFEKSLDFFTEHCEFDPSHPGNHVSWWTHKKIINLLEKSGFSTVYRSGYGQSVLPILRNTNLFDCTHPQISIYVEAIKG